VKLCSTASETKTLRGAFELTLVCKVLGFDENGDETFH